MKRLARALWRRARPLVWWGAVGLGGAALFAALWVAAYRFVNPPITVLMVFEWMRLDRLEREWRPLDEISPHLVRAVIAAEDAKFCRHYGFDFAEIWHALNEKDRRRGASTITQQVAKNVFLWPASSWTRKGLEAGFTVLIELFWPKARIIEVYLNVAETGPGRFGAEAAAQTAFARPAADLTLTQAARIAVTLPNPRERDAARPTAWQRQRAAAIADGAETLRLSGRAACATG